MKPSMQSSLHSSAKMKILSCFLVITFMFSFSAIPEVSARANQGDGAKLMQTKGPQKESKFPVCIDDSDCLKLKQGDKYACFKFLCYPWKDDTKISPKEKIQTCRRKSNCEDGKICYRHEDRRNVNKGLCFKELQECGVDVLGADGKRAACPRGHGCCGGYCCENKYFEQYKKLPCTNSIGCQDLGLGNFCCPQKGDKGAVTDSICCNTDPNAPNSNANTSDNKGAATSTSATAFTSSVISMGFFFLLF